MQYGKVWDTGAHSGVRTNRFADPQPYQDLQTGKTQLICA